MLNFHRVGSGDPLVLLHGIGMRWQWWEPCLELLAARHDVVAVDFPGFGGSARLAGDDEPTPIRLALAVEELCGELGLARPAVAGISMGGAVALELAKQDAVTSACAISPSGFWKGWERGWATASLGATSALTKRLAPRADAICATPAGRTAMFGQTTGRPWRIPAADAAAGVRTIAASDFDRTLPHVTGNDFVDGGAIEVPVTIAWGTRDRLLWPWQADRAVAAIPLARKVVLRGCGHIPTYDDPAQTVAAITGS